MRKLNRRESSTAGFTLLEVLVVVVMIGILSAIAVPSWLGMVKKQRVNSAQGEALQAMRVAQARAKQESRTWQVSFRENPTTNILQVAIHRENATPTWSDLSEQVVIDNTKTTIGPNTNSVCVSSGVAYCVKFDSKGGLETEWEEKQVAGTDRGKITFMPQGEASVGFRQCVINTTVLGSIRTAEGTDCN